MLFLLTAVTALAATTSPPTLVAPPMAPPFIVVQIGDSHTAGGYATTALGAALLGSAPSTASPPPVWGYVPPDSDTTSFATARLVGRWTKRTWLHEDGTAAGPGGRVATPGRGRAQAVLELRATLPSSTATPKTTTTEPGAVDGATPATNTATTEPGAVDDGAAGSASSSMTTKTTTTADVPLLPAGGLVHVLHDPATPLPPHSLRVDDVVAAPLPLPGAANLALQITSFSLPPGARRVVLDATGTSLRLFGWVVAAADARVAVDAMGVVGVTAAQALLRASPAVEDYLQWRSPDVVVVWLGTNDAVGDERERAAFPARFEAWLQRLQRAAPGARFVVMGPPDLARRPEGCPTPPRRRKGRLAPEVVRALVCRPETLTPTNPRQAPALGLRGVRDGHDWQRWIESCGHRSWPAVATVVEQERAIAARHGAMFFDVLGFMGGPGAMHGWACAEPPLASLDHVHLRPEGYAAVGRALGTRLGIAVAADTPWAGQAAPPARTAITPAAVDP
jgi:lysophospholipase L1-like esterase